MLREQHPAVRAGVRECTWTGTPIDGTTVERRSLPAMRPDELERRLRERLDALGPAPRAELLHVLMLPDFDRADRIVNGTVVSIRTPLPCVIS
jgi:hypothetical protein